MHTIETTFGFFHFMFLLHHTACGILVPPRGTEALPPALEAWNLNP